MVMIMTIIFLSNSGNYETTLISPVCSIPQGDVAGAGCPAFAIPRSPVPNLYLGLTTVLMATLSTPKYIKAMCIATEKLLSKWDASAHP